MNRVTRGEINQASSRVSVMLGKVSKMLAVVLAIIGANGCATKVQVVPPSIISCTEYLKPDALTYKCQTPTKLEVGDVFEQGLRAGVDAKNMLAECSLRFEELQTVLRVCKAASEKLKEDLKDQSEQE